MTVKCQVTEKEHGNSFHLLQMSYLKLIGSVI